MRLSARAVLKKGAPRRAPLFSLWPLWLAALGLLFLGPVQAKTACPADRIDEWNAVRSHHDGDTLRLADGRKLRIIGLDTPELGRDGKPDQPLSREARQALGSLLKQGKRIGLRYDQERHDRYGRTLAHLYLEDGRSIAAELLQQGLATLLIVPPNSWNYRCLARQEQAARKNGLGIWALPRYQTVASDRLKREHQGYRRIKGTVRGLGESRKALWVNLDGPMALRIPREHVGRFSVNPPKQWIGKTLIAAGWLRYHRGRYHINIKHPSAVEWINE